MINRLAAALTTVVLLLCSAPAQAAPPNTYAWGIDHPGARSATAQVRLATLLPTVWGSCGLIAKERKIVRTFKKRGGANVFLYCGGPKYTSAPTWGYRHIKWRHRDDWERKATGTYQNWRDVADLSIDATLKDPGRVGRVVAGKVCYSRVVHLHNLQTGKIVDFMIVRVIFTVSDRRIITSYPSTHCNV